MFIHITNSIYTRKYNAKLQPTMIGYLRSVGGLATLAGPLSSAILKFLPVWRQGGCIGVASHRILAAASPSGLDWSWLQPGQPRAWVATRCHQPLWKHKTFRVDLYLHCCVKLLLLYVRTSGILNGISGHGVFCRNSIFH